MDIVNKHNPISIEDTKNKALIPEFSVYASLYKHVTSHYLPAPLKSIGYKV